MVRIIACDLDGTLLKRHRMVTQYNADCIKKAMQHGIRWIVVTGRSYRGAKEFLEPYQISCDYILMNGAEFRNEQGNVIFTEDIDLLKAKAVCGKLVCEGLNFEINTDKGDYSTERQLYTDYIAGDWKFIFSENHIVRKILCFCKDISKLNRIKREIAREYGLSVLSSSETTMEVTAPKAQKGIMLLRAAEYYRVVPEEVAVFGDGDNDISMFTHFPESYAMKNGSDNLKKLSKYITRYTNEEDGVGRAICEMLKA